ncbi:lipase SIL1-like protein [Hordeum vulgare]|nr:lipase SIL1-like protein [Hordeum vulgare]
MLAPPTAAPSSPRPPPPPGSPSSDSSRHASSPWLPAPPPASSSLRRSRRQYMERLRRARGATASPRRSTRRTSWAPRSVHAVHGLGARAVTFAGLPPLGCLPLERAVNLQSPGDCNGMYNMAAVSFNRRLEGMLGRLGRELPGARVAYVDQYGLLSAMIARPWEYGFENSA